jgi:hypothetical protein
MLLTDTFGLSRRDLTRRPCLFKTKGIIVNPDVDAG